MNKIVLIVKFLIKRDFLKQRHAKNTDYRFTARRFGARVILTPLSRQKNQFMNADI